MAKRTDSRRDVGGVAARHGAKAYSPDGSRYHTNAVSVRGGSATMLPAAAADGTSAGFDAHAPTAYNVIAVDDNGASQQIARIDPRRLDSAAVVAARNQARATVDPGADADDVTLAAYAVLGEAQRVPMAAEEAEEVEEAEEAEEDDTVSVSPPAIIPELSPAAPTTTDLRLSPAMFADLLAAIRMPHVPAAVPAAPVPVPAAPVPVPAAPAEHGLDFLAAVPGKPKHHVIFEFDDGGTVAARYHHAQISAGCVVLVYDTRYEDGIQYVPPVHASRRIALRIDRGEPVYAASLGQQFQLGCMDVIVLVEAAEPRDG